MIEQDVGRLNEDRPQCCFASVGVICTLRQRTCRGGRAQPGKTYLISQLSKMLERDDVPNLQIAIDALGEGTDPEIQAALELDVDLISMLEGESVNEGILIIDGYDAARNEKTQRNILELIRKARVRLLAWNVIVVVRTFDAQKSTELADLFLPSSGMVSGQGSIPCRHFIILPLDQAEIGSLEEDSPGLLEPMTQLPMTSRPSCELLLIYGCSKKRCWGLRLWISGGEFSGSAPWAIRPRRVTSGRNGSRREHVLAVIAQRMVAQRNLSGKKDGAVRSPYVAGVG